MSNSADQPTPAPTQSPASTPAPPTVPSPPSSTPAASKSSTIANSPHKTPTPTRTPPRLLPRWKVLLHNDDVNDMEYIVHTLQDIVHMNEQDATLRTVEAHKTGVSLLLTTHRELAELYQQQFTSKNLTVTIEPAQ